MPLEGLGLEVDRNNGIKEIRSHTSPLHAKWQQA